MLNIGSTSGGGAIQAVRADLAKIAADCARVHRRGEKRPSRAASTSTGGSSGGADPGRGSRWIEHRGSRTKALS